ncbi:aromatic-ring-hydroxylating dioxygenase subunit beta [Mycolicibacterium sphagni]|nr:aromatic-ring-hydroxylating dioxygenase subunit beta [Mycolicibacterium sphagni]
MEAAVPEPATSEPESRGQRVSVTDPRHLQLVGFLDDESALLDRDDLTGWLAILAPEITYRAPVRTTRDHRSRDEFEPAMFHFNENLGSLTLKLMRFATSDSAWAENPRSRTHRIVHKVRVYETGAVDEYEVHSSVVLLRSRNDDPALEILPARRIDIVRIGDPFLLVSRTLHFDQTTLGVQNLTSYL